MKRLAWTVLLPAAGLLALAGATWLWPTGEAVGLLRPADSEVVARGETLYHEHCAACHGARLEGQENWQQRRDDGRLPAPPHDASGHTWHHPDRMLFEITRQGPAAFAGGGYESDMPAYDGVLSEPDIIAVLSFIKSTWPAAIRQRHDEINAQAEAH